MFNKLKQFRDLRNKAKTIQGALAQESVEVDSRGVKIVIDGNLEIQSISLREDIARESLEHILKDNLNEAIKKTQRVMAKKMQEMGQLPNFG